jgi:hypothetical protein
VAEIGSLALSHAIDKGVKGSRYNRRDASSHDPTSRANTLARERPVSWRNC